MTPLFVLVGIVGIAIASMLIYRSSPEGRVPDADAAARGGTFLFGRWVRDWFYWFLGPIERLSLSLGATPDFFNFLGLALGFVSLWLFADGRLALAGWVLLLGGVADILDGRIARARGTASEYGAFIDSTFDRFNEVAIFIGLAAYFRGGFAVLLVVIALGGSLLVSYTRARGESVGVVCKGGIMQRAERMLTLGFGSILDSILSRGLGWFSAGSLLVFLLGVIAVGTIGTAVYRTIWIARRLRTSS